MQASTFACSLSRRVATSNNKVLFQTMTTRLISVGTNMMDATDITLQKARPWYMSDSEGSILAKDNAVSMKDLFQGKTVAFFGVPAPFTGTCSNEHYPPYKTLAPDFKDAGVDEIICYAVSDPYAHHGWSVSLKNDPEQITFLADNLGVADFAKTFGVDAVYDEASLGQRSTRFSMLVANGVVTAFHNVEDASKDAETLLADAVAAAKLQAA
jgi:peroxiredoxin